MTLSIYAAKSETNERGETIYEPIVPFEAHNQWRLREDCDARSENGQDPFEPNPDYVQGAGFDISSGNWRQIARSLDLDPDGVRYSVEDVASGLELYGTNTISCTCGLNDMLYVADKVLKLQQMVALARRMGSDTIVAARRST